MKIPKCVTWKQFKKQLLSDPEVKKAYDELEPEYQLERSLIKAKIEKKMTQAW